MSTTPFVDQLEAYQRTQLHRETYIATLNSLLRNYGDKQAFAKKLNISPQYLSYLLDPLGDRIPSDDLARRIAKHIPTGFSERRELLYHITRARPDIQNQHQSDGYFDAETIYRVLGTMQKYQLHASNGRDSEQAKQAYRGMLKTGKWALYRTQPSIAPYKYAELLIYLHDASNAMNLPVTALWYAKSCLAICQKDHLWSHTLTEPRVWLWVNSLRMLSASFHNLNLPQQALDAAYEAAQFTMKHADSRVSKQAAPHLARDILNAYTIMPRFAISDAEAVADHYLDIMAVGSSSRHVLKGLATLLQRSLIEVYIKHGSKRSLKKAQLQLENSFYLGNNGNLGALCSTLHLRTRATLSRVLGDQYAFERSIHQAHQLSETAGLLHQQKEIIGEIRQYAQ